jgi:hypothetical protein
LEDENGKVHIGHKDWFVPEKAVPVKITHSKASRRAPERQADLTEYF